MQDYFALENLIEFGKIWLGTELGFAIYIMGIPLFFNGIAGEWKNGWKQIDFDCFFTASTVFTIFFILVYIFFW